jgi:uncharacterized protein (TIRG00374 family)
VAVKNAVQIILISLFISAAAIAFLLLTGDKLDPSAFNKLLNVNLSKLFLVVPFLVAWWVLLGVRIKILANALKVGEHVTLWRSIRAALLSLFGAFVTPAATGSSFGLGWYLSRFIDIKKATAIAVFGLVLDFVYYAWSMPLSFIVLELKHIDLGIPLIGVLIGISSVLLVAAAVGVTFSADFIARLAFRIFSLGFLKRRRFAAFAFVHRTGHVMAELRQMSLGTQLTLHLVNALAFLTHFAAFNVVAWGLGIPHFDHVAILACQSLLVSLGSVVPTPGGAGYMELGLGRVFAAIGVPDDAKTFLILIWRFLSNYLYILIGPFIGGAALLRASDKAPKNPL